MKRLFFVCLLLNIGLFTNFQAVYSSDKTELLLECHDFCGGYTTKAKNFAHDSIELEVTEVDDPKGYKASFPVGTKFYGTLLEHRGSRRISRDEIRKFRLEKAILPDGKTEKIDAIIKVRTVKKAETVYWLGNGAFMVSGSVLALTADAVTLGLPIARGGTAVWGAGHAVYETRTGESKLKEGSKGFLKGALMPLPFLILKGDPLYIHPGSTIVIHKDRDKEYINAALIRKYNDIKLEAEYKNKYGV